MGRSGAAVQEQDRAELERWLAEAYPGAYRTARFLLRDPAAAEDAVQEAFLRVWRFRDAVPAGDGRRPWLYRVVTNACLSRLRAEGSRPRTGVGVDKLERRPADWGDPSAAAEQGARSRAVVDALADLPEGLRVTAVLRWYAGLTEAEVATAIRRRPGTVKSRLHDAKRLLAADARLQAWLPDAHPAAGRDDQEVAR